MEDTNALVRDSAAMRDVSVRRIGGFALDRLWVLVSFYSVDAFVQFDDATSALYLSTFVSVTVMTLTLLGIAAIARRQARLYGQHIFLSISAALMVVGGAVTFLIDPLLGPNSMLLAVGGGLTGAGSAVLFIAWLELIAEHGVRGVAIEVALAYCAAFLAGLIILLCPDMGVVAIALALPAISAWMLIQQAKRCERPEKMKPFQPISASTRRFFARMLSGIFAFGALEGFMDWFTGYRAFSTPLYDSTNLLVWGFAATLAVALIAIFKRDDGLPLVYKLATALFFAGGAVLIFDGGLRAMASGVFFAGYGSLIVVLSAVCAKAFFSFRIGISRCIAACFGALYLGETAGSAISALTAAAGAAPPPTAAGLIVVCAIAGVYVFLFTEMDFVRLGLGEVEAVVPGEGNEDDGKAALAEDREDAIARVSSLVAERYGLSPRESEVLPLLLQGRTIARIQETLYISQGTVSTHIRHIYQKAGVDNRQDLLDLVEQIAHEHVVNRRSDAS